MPWWNLYATAYQSHDTIRAAVRTFLQQSRTDSNEESDINVGRLDKRLRLGECDQPLAAFFPPGSRTVGNTTIGVRCDGSKPWTIYVTGGVHPISTVLVAAKPLTRGKILTAKDVKFAKRSLTQAGASYIDDINDVVGKKLKRAIDRSTIVQPSMLDNPPVKQVVKKGDRVSIRAGKGGLDVRMSGQALDDGVRGEQIRVRNLSTKQVVEGRVVSPGLIQVEN